MGGSRRVLSGSWENLGKYSERLKGSGRGLGAVLELLGGLGAVEGILKGSWIVLAANTDQERERNLSFEALLAPILGSI